MAKAKVQPHNMIELAARFQGAAAQLGAVSGDAAKVSEELIRLGTIEVNIENQIKSITEAIKLLKQLNNNAALVPCDSDSIEVKQSKLTVKDSLYNQQCSLTHLRAHLRRLHSKDMDASYAQGRRTNDSAIAVNVVTSADQLASMNAKDPTYQKFIAALIGAPPF